MTTTCVRCGRPMAEQAYADQHCADQAAAQLAEIADMTRAARDIATGQASHSGGGGSGKPGSRLPLDLGATARLDAVQRRLDNWSRQIAAERGITPPWVTSYQDPILALSGWLSGQTEWLRHAGPTRNHNWTRFFEPPDQPDTIAIQFLEAVDACARVMRSLVRGPAEQKYLGPCGAIEQFDVTTFGQQPGSQTMDGAACEGDVYGRAGAQHGTCRTCGARVDQAERRAWLDDEVRQHSYTVVEIADAYPIKANTIRQWLSRGLLIAHGELSGRPLLKLGEVLDLAAGDAARREEARATRARRTAARAAESEHAA